MERNVSDVMQTKVLTVSPDTALPDLERKLLGSRVGALPVVDRDGRLAGIVSRSDVVRQLCLERSLGEAMADVYRDQTDESFAEKAREDVAVAIGKRMEQLSVRDVMIRDVLTAEPTLSLAKAAQRMIERRVHRLPVVEDGRLVGILTSLDLVRVVAEASEG
ncbi:MAG: CBS domain-containing protein [Myxococcota bacterium]